MFILAKVKAFRGIRFNTKRAGRIEQLVCPPYDIISEKQHKVYMEKNKNNIIRLELPQGENSYKSASKLYNTMKTNGVLIREDEPALYIYEETFNLLGQIYSIKGVIGRVKLEEFEKGVVLPHEYTLSKAKEDRMSLMKATNCNFSQVYSFYMDNEHKTTKKLDLLSNRNPDISLTDDDGIKHKLWIVKDSSQIESICSDFECRKLYIADGHHRYETALAYRDYICKNNPPRKNDPVNYIMMLLVDMEHPGLVVLPTHRLIKNLPEFNQNTIIDILEKCKNDFDIRWFDSISNVREVMNNRYLNGDIAFSFYYGNGGYYLLKLKNPDIMRNILPNMSPAFCKLDVTVLHSLILERLFGINKENMTNQTNLAYTQDIETAINSVNAKESQCAFLLNPTKVKQIKDVAISGEKMPQKSTYFYPKPITGLIVNELTD